MRNAVAVVALAALLTGCSSGTPGAGSQESGSPGSGSATGTSAPGSTGSSGTNPTDTTVRPPVSISEQKPVVPPDATPVPGDKVNATSLSDLYRAEAYVFGDGRDVEVFGLGGNCKEARAEVTAESAQVVQITLVTVTKQPPGTMCTHEVRQVPLTVRLSAPLGDRQLALDVREEMG
ncbi:hypothetical protein SAMN05216553_116170 [Lentzea fradiae]|uniref:Lipoprotein n=1 Tax=Lentzea fradiae TaxID=200378 RepID=A0A1G7ZYF7_9PSEU|nr:hypothetical protein [Lentzea fradiae]SDH13692.1 hypothetical protein SAMN05216553_116170 [Lentzea fradiae]